MITVRELIEHLQGFDQSLPVCYRLHSEHCLLEKQDVFTAKLSAPRPDGWVPDVRGNVETFEYLVFPGN